MVLVYHILTIPCLLMTKYVFVMPMEKFVSCVGDFVTLVGWVGRDLGPATPLVYVLLFLSFFVCPRGVGEWKVLHQQLLFAL